MKLVSCHVAHFGKIKEFTYDFKEGFNPILQENGWGKTTFSVFIKAMFYGLEYSPNTKKKLMERNHYLPWDGSLCGGSIVFTVKDKTYRIERTFGKTDKEDTYALYDQVTGLESKDYSANIGEELFKVDRDSFEKSVYIPQLSLNTAMTDSLNAKMGNLASAKDDISNFDIALKAVKDAKGEYTRNSKVNPGKLHGVKLEINKCKEDMEKLPGIVEGYEAQSCIIEEKQEHLDKLTEQKNALVEKIQNQSKREQELGAYRTYQANLSKEEENLAQLEEFFAAGVPDADELAILEQTAGDLAIHERSLERLNEEHRRNGSVFTKPFEEKLPDESEFLEWNEKATVLSELRAKANHSKLSEEASKQLAELKFFFDKKVPTEEELAAIEKQTRDLTAMQGRVSQANERVLVLKATNEAAKKHQKNKGVSLGMLLSIVLLLGFLATAAVFYTLVSSPYSLYVTVGSAVGAVVTLVVIILVLSRKTSDKNRKDEEYEDNLAAAEQELSELMDQKNAIEGECSDFLSYFLLTRAETMQENVYEIRRKLDQYKHLQEEEAALQQNSEGTLDKLADLQLELYTKIQPFANAYGVNLYEVGDELKFLSTLKMDAEKYSQYLVETEEIERHQASIKTMSQDIARVLSSYPVDKSLGRREQIHELVVKEAQYRQLLKRIAELKENIESFSQKNNLTQDVESVDDLQKQQVELDEMIVDLNRQLISDKENMSRGADEIERLGDVQEHLERLENLEVEYKQKTELLSMTADLLTKARESFLSKYMEPLQNGLHKYLGLLDSPEGTKSGYAISAYELDMDLNIKLDYSGSTKTSDYLSQGYQDLVALCSRLALVDVLYSDEKPILILDDPFTNLDDKKIKESLKLLQNIAQERQIIYFTCHDSRL